MAAVPPAQPSSIDWTPALRHLAAADPRLQPLIERHGPPTYEPTRDPVLSLARAIVYQQLSGKAAATIWGRVEALYGGRPPTPAEVLRTGDEALRAAGLSRQKLGYLKDLAARAASGELPVESLHELDDAAILEAARAVKGIGTWTVQMFLIFRLGRPDVLPVGDLGIRKAVQRAYRLRALPAPAKIEKIAEAWRPHCSVASWYLWRSLE